MPGLASTTFFAAVDTKASTVPTGLGVKSRMKSVAWLWLTPSSAQRAMRAMVATALEGAMPLAVSPESMTASTPSKTALATSVISARVGSTEPIIDSSICVAQMTNLPAMWHLVVIHFWAIATFSEGISMPRSPRAIITPSVYLRISSKLLRPSSFSILEMILMCWPPASSRILRMNCTSSPVCTNDAATKSTLFLHPKFWRSSMSFSVSTGMSTFTPGRLQFLRSPRVLLLRTLPLSVVASRISTTSMEIVPSAHRMTLPGLTLWHSLAYDSPMRVSSSVLKPSNSVYLSPTASTMMSCPASRVMAS
mmetsp:Transcript_39082/g.124422  ORF Transcript_39082/g.124422 Transcript_39082/m.124422 type:complete len:308 (+) Transcript_39082:1953-2876(+)